MKNLRVNRINTMLEASHYRVDITSVHLFIFTTSRCSDTERRNIQNPKITSNF